MVIVMLLVRALAAQEDPATTIASSPAPRVPDSSLSSSSSSANPGLLQFDFFAASQPGSIEPSNVTNGTEASQQGPPTSAPGGQASPASTDSERNPQTNRILEIIPNFRAISTDEKLPPQSVKEKFLTCTEDSFDYSSIFVPVMLAGYSMATRATPEFGSGGVGYSRYLWHTAVDQTSENYMVEFFVPVLTREDTRYYTLGRGGFFKRAGYALSRAVVTRSDSGRDVFNLSEVVGAGAAAGLSTLYYPSRERSLANTGTEWGVDIAVDAMAFVAKEFWPDINHWLTRSKKPAAVGTP